MFGYQFCGKRDLKEQVSNDHSTQQPSLNKGFLKTEMKIFGWEMRYMYRSGDIGIATVETWSHAAMCNGNNRITATLLSQLD